MPATWYPFGLRPDYEPPYIKHESVRGVKGYDPPLRPIRRVVAVPIHKPVPPKPARIHP